MISRDQLPLRVQLTRGSAVESEHLVDAVIADRSGAQRVWGNPDRITFPRSAIKAIQALPLVMTGAADHYQLSDEHLALACSSHNAEDQHLAKITEWLAVIGGSQDWLECGPARPISDEVWLNVGSETTRLHNCCSGKHTGFLTVARQLEVPVHGYLSFDHPVQKLVTQATEVFIGMSLDEASAGIDGCGIPTFPMPLARLAHAMARLVDPRELGNEWSEACNRMVTAIHDKPWWVSGTDRHEVFLSQTATEPLVSKTGADGVFTAALPERGLGIACKSRDGARRSSDAAISAVLSDLGVLPLDAVSQPITNTLSEIVGYTTVEIPG